MSACIESWGGLSVETSELLKPEAFLADDRARGSALPYGNGRSYGDSCLNASGTAIATRKAGKIISFDETTGLLQAEAGLLLSELIDAVAPAGWFPAVLPGTQFVTLGGAIANDIHGKNHHRRGTFGCHVTEIHLDRTDRGSSVIRPGDETGLFEATVGGLGLTGLIRRASVHLMRIGASSIRQETTRFNDLEEYFGLARDADERHEYAVAWLDSISKGKRFGRGHLIAGDHASEGGHQVARSASPLKVPFTPPVTPLQGPFLRLFNEAYFRGAPAGVSTKTVGFEKFFFPLDRIGRWNRLYGPRGLHQHQSVIPEAAGFETVKKLLECTQANRHGSFLTVLKRFGQVQSPGFMSFPRAGYTLTLDFPDKGGPTLRLLEQLDEITLAAGGAVNPYKDRRMSAATFKASFPEWQKLEAMRDPALLSDFWRRTALCEGDRGAK
ncbi:MAG: FAD-binding oxidoreductase [Roseibium sp.]|uniref:FAD-binding protein n=1 Tax=Roseibium sp. TaxID=1936156 RepID=UPI003D9C3347